MARDLGERGFEVVATAVDGAAALRIVAAVRPDVVLMDLHFGADGQSGAETTRCLIDSWPHVKVLVLSASGAHADVLAAVQAGASGYLMKSAPLDELVDAVRRTAEGDAVFTAGLAGLLLGEYRRIARGRQNDVPQLTERETEVLRRVATGHTARQIADALVISHRTVSPRSERVVAPSASLRNRSI